MPGHVQDGSMPVTVIRQQVDRILHSGEFPGSEVLRNLLSFLTEHSIDRPGEAVKEYELAVAVLGKAEGFDPRLDSAVRVHAARLRAKLAEYYMADGAEDPVLIEVPKGSCHVAWRYRAGELLPQPKPLPEPPSRTGSRASRRRWFAAGFVAAAVLAVVGLVIWISARPAKIPLLVQDFWLPFLKSPQAPLVVFSNHRFASSSAAC